MIKSWKELTKNERESAFSFLKSPKISGSNLAWDDRKKILFGPAFDRGENLFFSVDKEIKAALGAVTLEIPVKGEAYITSVSGEADFALVEHANDFCFGKGAEKVYAGITPGFADGFIEHFRSLGYTHVYSLLDLVLIDEESYDTGDDLLPLDRNNAGDFARIMTKAFENSPNGASMTTEEALDMIDEDGIFGLFTERNQYVGAFEMKIRKGIGHIDSIAIAPEHQRKGLGRKMLGQLIEVLWDEEVKEIRMTVIDANRHAFEMYLDFGFKTEKVLSEWYLREKE